MLPAATGHLFLGGADERPVRRTAVTRAGAGRALEPPRNYYQWYFSSRRANADTMGCPQGLHQFLPSYYHFKSADWPGNTRPPALRRTAGSRGDPGPERAAAERRHQAPPQHGVLTAGMDFPAHRTADRGHLAAHPRFPRASDYHSGVCSGTTSLSYRPLSSKG